MNVIYTYQSFDKIAKLTGALISSAVIISTVLNVFFVVRNSKTKFISVKS